MSIEHDAQGRFSPEEAQNVLVPCALGAITFEIFESFKSILFAKRLSARHPIVFENKPHKVKLFQVLKNLVTVKPEFILGMGRLTDDIMPTIQLLLKKDTDDLDKLEVKLLNSMRDFIEACGTSYDKMEEIDQTRFQKVNAQIKDVKMDLDKKIKEIK